MTFPEFIAAYTNGEIAKNPAWRAYDIENSVSGSHYREALKHLGYSYAGELGFSLLARDYGINSAADARTFLGIWWVLRRVEAGTRGIVKKRPQTAEGR